MMSEISAFYLYFVIFWRKNWCRNSDGAILRSSAGENRKSASPEKEDRYYTTRGSAEENGKVAGDGNNGEERALVWPKLYITLSSKEKEEDFLAMKGCKLPQRPKKRAKIIQRSLLVSFALLCFVSLSKTKIKGILFLWEKVETVVVGWFGIFIRTIPYLVVCCWCWVTVGEPWSVVNRYVPREIWS